MKQDLLAHLKQQLEKIPHYQKIYVGYSGGLDSQVLVHALHQLKLPITAIYINHQLSPNALVWQQHCQDFCQQQQINFTAIAVNAKPAAGEGPEAAARHARYQAFKSILAEDDLLLLAQHQDDQAETLLLQLLRGAGPKGLAAMASLSAIGPALLLRPFLGITRAELAAYAQEQGLTWIEDESNQSERYDRNFLRLQVLPILSKRWPQYTKTVARSAQLCAESLELFDEVAQQDLMACLGPTAGCLVLSKLKTLSKARRHNLLRYWLEQQGFSMPSQKQVQQFELDFFHAAADAQPKLCWPGAELRLYQDELYALLPQEPFDKTRIIPFAEGEDLSIRFRQGGEQVCLDKRQGHRCLKKVLQEWHIPPWQRARLPLLYLKDKLVAVYNPHMKKFLKNISDC